MQCELCGRDVRRTKRVIIEGVVLNVCNECAKFGVELGGKSPTKPVSPPDYIRMRIENIKRRKSKRRDFIEEEEVLVEDYGDRVRKARERMNLTQEELASKINEKSSVIAKIERYEFHPDKNLIKKLEKFLGIKLTEKVSPIKTSASGSSKTLTLGDLIEMELKKKKG